jgi:hypothetical protein
MSGERIRELNDAFRTTMSGGKALLTAGVDALPSDVKAMVIRKVATFSDFTADNDPHGEHDFGSFELTGRKFFWKIDLVEPCYAGNADLNRRYQLICYVWSHHITWASIFTSDRALGCC